MADTSSTVTTANDAVIAAGTNVTLIQEARSNLVIADKVMSFMFEEGETSRVIPSFQALAMAAYSTENANADAVAVTTDGSTVTAALATVDFLIPDKLKGSSYNSFSAQALANAGRAAADYVEKAIHALHVGLSVVKGTTGNSLSVASMREAIASLEGADPMQNAEGTSFSGPAFYLHPTQILQLRTEIGSSASAIFTQASATEIMDAANNGRRGLIGAFHGIPVFSTTAIVTDGTDLHGALIVPSAYCLGVKYLANYEFFRDVAKRSDRHAITSYFGVVEVKDAWGVELISVD